VKHRLETFATVESRACFAILAAAAVGVPLLIAPGLSLHFDITPKVVLLLSGTAAALLCLRAWHGGWRLLSAQPLGHVLLGLLGIQLASLLLSTLFSTQPAISFGGSNWRRLGFVSHGGAMLFVAVLSAYLVAHRERFRPLLRLLALGGLAAAIYGILQYFGIDPWVPAEAYHIGEGEWTIVRTPGTLGHAGYYATYLLAAIFWALALAQGETSRLWRIVALGCALLGSLAVVLSGTRGAIVGLLAGAAVALIWRRPRWNRRTAAVALLAVCALGAFYYSPLGERLRARTRWYIEDPTGGGRVQLWRDSLRMFTAGPWWTGTGLETYSAEFPRFLSPELARAYPNRYYESPHNIFVDALTSQGFVGLLFLAGMTALAAAAAWRLRRSDSAGGVWLAAAFVATLCGNQFLAFTLPTALYFYLSVALLVIPALSESKSPASMRAPLWGWVTVVSPAVVLAVFAAQLLAADHLLLSVQGDAHSGQIAEAAANYEQARQLMPWGMNVDLWFSRLIMTASEMSGPAASDPAWEAATKAARRAAELAPERQAACYSLALLHGLRSDAVQAEAALRRTIAVAPAWYKPHWMLAQHLRVTGRLDEALREAKVALELNGGANPEVAETWEQLRSLNPGVGK
jgi:O-antigen ligase